MGHYIKVTGHYIESKVRALVLLWRGSVYILCRVYIHYVETVHYITVSVTFSQELRFNVGTRHYPAIDVV